MPPGVGQSSGSLLGKVDDAGSGQEGYRSDGDQDKPADRVAVVGYLYFIETAILAIPGANAIYPYLPGGATAAITDFGYLADAMALQTGHASGQLLPTAGGALVRAAYTLVAAAAAVAFPVRRDVT